MLILENPGLKKLFPSYQNLLKSHIDYILMSLLLFAFYLLYAHFDITPHGALVIATCMGSLINPFGFLLLAMKPDLAQNMPKPIGALVIGGFILTTTGYAGGALLVAKAVLSA